MRSTQIVLLCIQVLFIFNYALLVLTRFFVTVSIILNVI